MAAEGLIGRQWEVTGDELTWELRPRDNQIACAAVLARGDVAELDTGEGKTLCAATAAACWTLVGRGHVVTEQVDLTDNLCHQFNEAVEAMVAEQEEVKARLHQEIDEVSEQRQWSAKPRRFEETFPLDTAQ